MSVTTYLRTNILAYWWQLLLFIVSANVCGIVPTIFSDVGPTGWYASLDKPGFTPPNAVFLPVWLFLYFSMGLAAFLVWRDGGGFTGKAGLSLRIYIFSLMLNMTWTPVFFNGQSPPAVRKLNLLSRFISTFANIVFVIYSSIASFARTSPVLFSKLSY